MPKKMIDTIGQKEIFAPMQKFVNVEENRLLLKSLETSNNQQ